MVSGVASGEVEAGAASEEVEAGAASEEVEAGVTTRAEEAVAEVEAVITNEATVTTSTKAAVTTTEAGEVTYMYIYTKDCSYLIIDFPSYLIDVRLHLTYVRFYLIIHVCSYLIVVLILSCSFSIATNQIVKRRFGHVGLPLKTHV